MSGHTRQHGESEVIERLRAENVRLRRELGEALERIHSLEETKAGLESRLAELERKSARQAAPFRRDLLPHDDFAAKRQHLEGTCRQLLDELVTQPGDLAVQKRLLKQQAHLLGFGRQGEHTLDTAAATS